MSTVCLSPNVEVPCSSELHNTSLDASLTPKADESSYSDDICSSTLVDETASVLVTRDVKCAVTDSDVKPLSPSSEESADEPRVDDADEGDVVSHSKPLSAPSEESYDGCTDGSSEQPSDVADDNFFSASEGEPCQ